ncbi:MULTISPECIES: hypothetical protein [unclassified Pseudomonas]|uniref:hypothetical protein n=1 Tax=unclassified Pseudomonas TaxID=196821 RepID=UPI0015AE6E27|nr:MULTISPECIES: hypothetical protein [unclassified Pseudomonas]
MMFIAQAVRQLAEFKRDKPNMKRTLVIFTPFYTESMLSAARKSAQEYSSGLVTVTDAGGLINYLNTGKDRSQSPIEHLAVFSHGVPQSVAFGYQLSEGDSMALDVLNYERISPLAFSSSARIDSYACRTGMGNKPDYRIEEVIQFFPQTNESLAQLLANHLGIKVGAFVRRSDYKNTWGTFEERQTREALRAITGVRDWYRGLRYLYSGLDDESNVRSHTFDLVARYANRSWALRVEQWIGYDGKSVFTVTPLPYDPATYVDYNRALQDASTSCPVRQ